MRFTHHINGWESFIHVDQDTRGMVVKTGGGLWTSRLSNCICLILSDEANNYGMLHVSPGHKEFTQWVTSLRKEVGATAAIVTGANVMTQELDRQNQLATMLAGLRVVDETRAGWVPAVLNPVRGSNTLAVGYAAVNANNGDYALSIVAFKPSVAAVAPARNVRRNSEDGACVIL